MYISSWMAGVHCILHLIPLKFQCLCGMDNTTFDIVKVQVFCLSFFWRLFCEEGWGIWELFWRIFVAISHSMATTSDKMSPSQCSHGDNRQFTMCFLDHRSAKCKMGTSDCCSTHQTTAAVMRWWWINIYHLLAQEQVWYQMWAEGHGVDIVVVAMLFVFFPSPWHFHIFLLLSWWLLFFTFCSCNCCVFYASSSSRELE